MMVEEKRAAAKALFEKINDSFGQAKGYDSEGLERFFGYAFDAQRNRAGTVDCDG